MLWYLLAAFATAAVWAAWLLLGLPLWAAILLTVLMVGSLVAVTVVRRLQARKAAREIERALTVQAEAHARSARPDLQPEIQEMQAEFAKAVSALKSSKLGRGGRDALSVLPFYMIIGPPGAGKSTALRNSGLQFPYLSARGGGVKGVGGTRNCEWWLTNEAVLLDTAGRYTTEDDDREEWLSFLDTLARTRSRRPINGLLVAVSVGELLDVGPEAAAELGQKLRERVDEVMARLKVVLPVYLLLTKCDLLAGFVESFGDLNKNDRGQMWGFTLPLGKREGGPAEVCQRRFDELVGALERHTLARVGRERRQEARQLIYQFPQQVEGLRANLLELVGTLFAENVYQDTPLMRGVYFTSGTQEGRAIDRIMSRMAEAFGVQRALGGLGLGGGLEAAVEAKSYFLRDVFSGVLFPDADVAAVSSSERQRLTVRRHAALGGALVFALVVLLFPTLAYFRGRTLVDSTRERLAALAPQAAGKEGAPAALAALGPARERLAELHGYESEGPPAALRWGMYPGAALYGAARSAYGEAIRRTLLEPLLHEDARDLEAFARSVQGSGEPPTEKEYVRYFDKLKLQLLLTGPRGEGEPGLGAAEQAWVGGYVAERWRRRPGASADAAAVREVEAHVKMFAQLAADDAELLGARPEVAVRGARAALARVPFAHRALEKLVQSPAFEPYELTLGSIVGAGVSQLRSPQRVHGAFTRKGWEEVVQKAFEGDLGAEDAWVLGLAAEGGAEERMRLLEAFYFQRYVQEWRTFLESVRVSTPASSAEALALLEDLTRGVPSPLGRLFAALATNVQLGGAVEEAAEMVGGEMMDRLKKRLGADSRGAVQAAAGAVGGGGSEVRGPRDLERVFSGLLRFGAPATKEGETRPFDIYQEQLVFLRDGVRTDLENPDDHGPLLSRLQTARVRVASLVEAQDIGWRPLLQALLWPPVEGVSRVSTQEAAAGTSQRWCGAVVSAYDRSLAHRYPFDPDGHDAAIADVADFFRPGDGVVWGFYADALKGDMLREGNRFTFTRRMGNVAANIYSPAILTFLGRADELSSTLFAPGAGELGVQFSAHIQPSPGVASITLTVDGQSVDYRNGPEEWHALKWPAAGKTLGASLKVRTTRGATETIAQEGEWGLFRLLERGSVRASPGARVFTVVWKVESLGVEVAVDFRPSRTETPFFGVLRPGQKPQLMRPFRGAGTVPPRAIGKGSQPCEG